jgi:hypothetical protein
MENIFINLTIPMYYFDNNNMNSDLFKLLRYFENNLESDTFRWDLKNALVDNIDVEYI